MSFKKHIVGIDTDSEKSFYEMKLKSRVSKVMRVKGVFRRLGVSLKEALMLSRIERKMLSSEF